MAIRDLMTVDGRPACEVDTAEELSQRLVPGVYVRAPRAVLFVDGTATTENTDTDAIAAAADWRHPEWIADGGD